MQHQLVGRQRWSVLNPVAISLLRVCRCIALVITITDQQKTIMLVLICEVAEITHIIVDKWVDYKQVLHILKIDYIPVRNTEAFLLDYRRISIQLTDANIRIALRLLTRTSRGTVSIIVESWILRSRYMQYQGGPKLHRSKVRQLGSNRSLQHRRRK